MQARRFVRASFTLFLIALGWNALVHVVLLRQLNASVQHLRRPDLPSKWWLALILTAGIVGVFTWGYARFVSGDTIREGLTWGAYFALAAGLLVDLNQYVLFPIPARVAAAWFLAGLLEFSLYGVLLTRLYPHGRAQPADVSLRPAADPVR